MHCLANAHCGMLGCRGFGIDTAERLLRDLGKDTHTLERAAARLRLEQVLETYTDVTRFPVYVPCNNGALSKPVCAWCDCVSGGGDALCQLLSLLRM